MEPGFEVQWFEGSAEQAFTAAKQQDKPLFLYWGAEWCPPCHELKATVFSEPSFVQASQQFIALYLDGDSPGAQQQAERFKVMGYPTLVVFNAQGVELTRIPNGLDLAAYATVLDSVLEDLRPVHDILTLAGKAQALSPAECQAVAQHSWSQDSGELSSAELLAGLEMAQQQCPAESQADRAALFLRRLILTQTQTQTQAQAQTQTTKVSISATQRAEVRQELLRLFEQPKLLTANFYLFLDAGEPLSMLFGRDEQPDEEILAGFVQHYEQLANDAEQSLFNRIQVSRALFALRGREASAASAANLQKANLALAKQAQDMDRGDSKFHATINAAGNLLRESGELEQAKNLLLAESEKSKYGYYFMSELAHIEQLLGNEAEALKWLEKAYRQSRGPATRFQWGVNYLRGLLELDANNKEQIEKQFTDFFSQLPTNSVMYQRSRVRLAALQEDLERWSDQDAQRVELYQQLSALAQPFQAKQHNE